MHVELARQALRFAKPIQTSYGTLHSREIVRVRLTDADGVSGWGEAAPLEPYDAVPIERVEQALELYRPLLERSDGSAPAALYDACRELADLPQALAAVDLALWDRAGRRAGKPVCALIADAPASRIEVSATIVATDRQGAANEAAAAAAAGYRCVKVKVGLPDDAGRVAAVRAALGPHVALRLDANGAWDVEQAVRTIEALSPAGLELVEEPVHGVDPMRELRKRTTVRIAVDETADEPGALDCADAVALKISRCGGISSLLAAATLVRAKGAEPYITSTYDGPAGIAAALHCAAALAPLPPCGLATSDLFEGANARFTVDDGELVVPNTPGLGFF
jgi:o-succinylbenzoate synthase